MEMELASPFPESLSGPQRDLVARLVAELAGIDGVEAVALAGSHARGCARAGSDVDLGVFYDESHPFAIEAICALAGRIDTGGPSPGGGSTPVVSDFYEWGRWVNGGAWLTVEGERIDFLYRSFQHVERTIDDAEAGRFEIDFAQQPPFGFHSVTYLGEVAIALPLFDPRGRLAPLAARTTVYPEALRTSIVGAADRSLSFGLQFARKLAARGEVPGAVGCLTRFANDLVQALFALNRRYFVNDKTALTELASFVHQPPRFGPRLCELLAEPGLDATALGKRIDEMQALHREVGELAARLLTTPAGSTPA